MRKVVCALMAVLIMCGAGYAEDSDVAGHN